MSRNEKAPEEGMLVWSSLENTICSLSIVLKSIHAKPSGPEQFFLGLYFILLSFCFLILLTNLHMGQGRKICYSMILDIMP